LFNLAIDSKLRGCNVVAVRVADTAAGTAARASETLRMYCGAHPNAGFR
jgi:hypothetical protein